MPKLIAGAVVDMAEEAISDHSGIEYVITTHHGQTLTIVQNYVQGDPSIKIGARVMIQTSLTICIGSACSEAVMNGRYFWSCAARTAI